MSALSCGYQILVVRKKNVLFCSVRSVLVESLTRIQFFYLSTALALLIDNSANSIILGKCHDVLVSV